MNVYKEYLSKKILETVNIEIETGADFDVTVNFCRDEYNFYLTLFREGEELEFDLYFLYYEIGEYSFHSAVSEKIAESNTELEIQEIDENFKTHGSKIEGLLSMQFVKKVLELLQSEDYTIVNLV